MRRSLACLLLTVTACGGAPFSPDVGAGASSGVAPDSGWSLSTADAPTELAPDAASGPFSDGGPGADVLEVEASIGKPDVDAPASDAGEASIGKPDAFVDDAAADASRCPAAGCLCVAAAPPACPAGFPYVPRTRDACCNWPQP